MPQIPQGRSMQEISANFTETWIHDKSCFCLSTDLYFKHLINNIIFKDHYISKPWKLSPEATLHRYSYKKVFLYKKFSMQLYWNHTSAWCFPVNLLHIFRTPFLKTHLEDCFYISQCKWIRFLQKVILVKEVSFSY